MLDSESPRYAHAVQTFALVLLSVIFLPTSALAVLLSYFRSYLQPTAHPQRRRPATPKRILVTGVGMTKGLALARLFHLSGHTVIGADFSSFACGRMSYALSSFYTLSRPSPPSGSAPYVKALLNLIDREGIDLWVSCSGVASAVEDGEAKEAVERETTCKAVQFDVNTTARLHEKGSYMEYTKDLGLNIPETHTVTSIDAVRKVLYDAQRSDKEFVAKSIGVDDSTRGDMTLLPLKRTDDTERHIQRLKISDKNPFILQQYIHGAEYCTHALVIQGTVKAFVACPSSELLMHYIALPADSPLNQAMLSFTKSFSAQSGPEFTGHLSFDFLVPEPTPTDGKEIALYPIECNPRAHTAVVLFSHTPSLADAYLSLLHPEDQAASPGQIITPVRPAQYYWVAHDLLSWAMQDYSYITSSFGRTAHLQAGIHCLSSG